jgi:hypothetical protein
MMRTQIHHLSLEEAAGVGMDDDMNHLTATELTVERINVVDADGMRRLVLSGRERFPDPAGIRIQ